MGDEQQPNRAADDEVREKERQRERGGKVTCSLGWENGGDTSWVERPVNWAPGKGATAFTFTLCFLFGSGSSLAQGAP
jgi:hypothetical protein